MKNLKSILTLLAILFVASAASAANVPWLKKNKLYNATNIIYNADSNNMDSYDAGIGFYDIGGTETILVTGVGADDELDFVIHLKTPFTRSVDDDGTVSYIGIDEFGNGVLVGEWFDKQYCLLFYVGSESVIVLYDKVPIADL